MKVGIRKIRKIERAHMVDACNNIGAFDGWLRRRVDDHSSFEEATKDGSYAVTNAVVTGPFRNFLAVEYVVALGIDGAATEASGEVGGRKDVQIELLLEANEEEITGFAVCFYTSGHGDERVGGGRDEDFGEVSL